MKVILLQKVRKLGDLGSEVTVRKGYGRNYLIPQGLAVPATKDNIANFDAQRAKFEQIAQEAYDKASIRAQALNGQVVTHAARASDEGRLFGSVGAHEIVTGLKELGFVVDKNEIRIHEPIRQVGEYEIELLLHHDVISHIKLSVQADS